MEELITISDLFNNKEACLARKWKEVRYLYEIFQQADYRHGSIENALWFYGHKGITVHHFVMAIISEFQFARSLHIDRHLRFLYWCCEGGKDNDVDWREILAAFKILIYYKMIKSRPMELLVTIFDIYGTGTGDPNESPNEKWYIPGEFDSLLRIFLLPCISLQEISSMKEQLHHALVSVSNGDSSSNPRMTRAEFRNLLFKNTRLCEYWNKLCWDRLPSDLRLQALDDAQVVSIVNIDTIMYKYKMRQAILISSRSLYRNFFREWKLYFIRRKKVHENAKRRILRMRKNLFKFWRLFSRFKVTKRRRRLLAEVMGNYAMKSRVFARIKLFNYTSQKLTMFGATLDKFANQRKLGAFHVREFQRLRRLRQALYRWWNETGFLINMDLSIAHDFRRRLLQLFQKWGQWAHTRVHERRHEMMVLENKHKFDKIMEEADADIATLMELERQRQEKFDKAAEEAKLEEKEKLRENAQLRMRAMKEEEKRLLIDIQRDIRRKRIRKQLKAMKKKFKAKWKKIRSVRLEAAKVAMTSYMNNKDNELAMQLKFEKLKREFFAPPTEETRERERVLTSPKNIVFLFLEAKIKSHKLNLNKVIAKFDKEKKGYLTYDEFTAVIRSLGVTINPTQMSEVIHGVDFDGDGVIEMKELEESMKDIVLMGVPGSPWKLYVDPAQDVICYHNMITNEKIFEYQMTDEKLQEILRSNLVNEAEYNANVTCNNDQKEAWEFEIKNYMARRLQYMYRQWKERRERSRHIWKVNNREEGIKRIKQRTVVNFIEWCFVGFRSRIKFKREIHLCYEKCWDTTHQRVFYYNHLLKTSSWDRPRLLWRYGDVAPPSPWVPYDVATEEGRFVLHYWHVPSGTELPRKPDGLLICCHCQRQLAIHYCHQCQRDYCPSCLREIHHSIYDFFQSIKPSAQELVQAAFIHRMEFMTHTFRLCEQPRCQLCNSEQLLAGIQCKTCEKKYCRPCSRRIHSQRDKLDHEYYDI